MDPSEQDEFPSGSYRIYRKGHEKFLGWLIKQAKQLGIDSVPSDPSPRERLGSLRIPVNTMSMLTQEIANRTTVQTPKALLEGLDDVIFHREEVTRYYDTQRDPLDREAKSSNHKHHYVLDSLRKAKQILKSCPTQTPVFTPLSQFASYAVGLEIPQKKPSVRFADDSSIASRDPEIVEAQAFERPLDAFDLKAGLDEDEQDEIAIAAWFLFRDMEVLRFAVLKAWLEYRSGGLSLLTASFLSTYAVEAVRVLEQEFWTEFEHGFETGGDYLGVLTALLSLDPDNPEGHASMAFKLLPASRAEFYMCFTWSVIRDWANRLSGKALAPKPFTFVRFEPNADRSKMNAEELWEQDRSLIQHHLHDVQSYAAMLGPHSYPDFKKDGEILEEPCLVGDMRMFITDPKRRIPIHMVFQWDIWKEIVIINRRNLQDPFDALHRIAGSMAVAIDSWLNNFDEQVYPQESIDHLRSLIQTEILGKINGLILVDPLGSPHVKPFALYLNNPWACGVASYTVMSLAHHASIQVINITGFLSSTLQLYDCLKQYDRVTTWPHMDRLLRLCSPTIYRSFKPSPGGFLRAFQLSRGQDSAGEHITFEGVEERLTSFPDTFGGLIISQMSQLSNYRLDRKTYADVFCRLDAGEEQQSPGMLPADRRKRHTSLSVLAALKEHIETELKDSALNTNLFGFQEVSVSVLRRVWFRTNELFKEINGKQYPEVTSQLPLLVGAIFQITDTRSLRKNLKKAKKLMDEAATAVNNGREDFTRRVEQGLKPRYY